MIKENSLLRLILIILLLVFIVFFMGSCEKVEKSSDTNWEEYSDRFRTVEVIVNNAYFAYNDTLVVYPNDTIKLQLEAYTDLTLYYYSKGSGGSIIIKSNNKEIFKRASSCEIKKDTVNLTIY